ncbi:cytochrome p450 [Colletotrichum truncatum]|uniref:Cytochrome p450 n=1 Tax=Colletotrichum truncatum TaxID=5467 RepID=A0ACC3YD93_COLTU
MYLASIVFYNLFLHPLRDYPGPILLRVTRIGYCYKLIRGTLPFDILQLHKVYGDVVRIAPDELAYNNVTAWKDIMGHRGRGAAEFKKYQHFYNSSKAMPTTIVSSNGREHADLRRTMSHGFSESSLRNQEPLVMKYIDGLVQKLHEMSRSDTKAIDLMAWYNFTTFDIIGDLAFGEPFGCIRDSDYHPWIRGIFASVRLGTVVQTANHYPFFKKILFSLLSTKSSREKKAHNLVMATEKLQRRIAAGSKQERPDLIEGLLKKKDEMGLSMPQLIANSNTLIIAGSETTATLLSGVTYQLLKSGHALRTLTEEVRSRFKASSDINIVSVGQLPYMMACLNETLRIYPPVASGLPRVTPASGATICGRLVPGNVSHQSNSTVVAIHQYAIHNNEKYFKDPLNFHPERFLGDTKFASDNRDAFQPFHIGPRNCIGRNLAYVEMKLILAQIVWHFDLELAEESQGWAEKQKIFILWDKAPLMVHLRAVKRS